MGQVRQQIASCKGTTQIMGDSCKEGRGHSGDSGYGA